jgi:hypothetical protein
MPQHGKNKESRHNQTHIDKKMAQQQRVNEA